MTLVPVSGDLAGNTPDAQLERLRCARQWIASASGEDALSGYNGARLVQAWVRINKAAREVGAEAARLEMTALRRVGQLGAAHQLPPNSRAVATAFAAMTEDEFDAALDSVQSAASAVSIWRQIRAQQQEADDQKRGVEVGRGRFCAANPVRMEDLEEATRSVLAAAFDAGRATTVTEAARDVAHALDLEEEFRHSSAVRHGLRTAVRDALRHEAVGSPMSGEMPPFITYLDSDAGWVRIPAHVASVDQVIAWAAFRMEQAKDSLRKAQAAEDLAARLSALRREIPGVARASELLERAAGQPQRKAG